MAVEKKRCGWVEDDPLYIEYHDKEWGRPLRRNDELFERLTLEMFQAGLSWRLILKKRKAFKNAFADFSIDQVASFSERDIARLLGDKGIIRNRLKIECTIENARRLKGIIEEHGSFAKYIEKLDGDLDDLTKEFRRKFKFMGPEIVRCFLLSIGKLEGVHDPDCFMAPKPGRGKSKKKSSGVI